MYNAYVSLMLHVYYTTLCILTLGLYMYNIHVDSYQTDCDDNHASVSCGEVITICNDTVSHGVTCVQHRGNHDDSKVSGLRLEQCSKRIRFNGGYDLVHIWKTFSVTKNRCWMTRLLPKLHPLQPKRRGAVRRSSW